MKLHDPRFIIFTGPMFGSKTTRMLAALERFTYQNLRVMAFKPRMDDRYAKEEISTHPCADYMTMLFALCISLITSEIILFLLNSPLFLTLLYFFIEKAFELSGS